MAKIHAKILLYSRLRKTCERGLHMKTVKEYAMERGITHQAVYQMLSTHKDELDDLIVMNGRTRYLTPQAEAILDQYRSKATIVVEREIDNALIEQLKNEKAEFIRELAMVTARLEFIQNEYDKLTQKQIEWNNNQKELELEAKTRKLENEQLIDQNKQLMERITKQEDEAKQMTKDFQKERLEAQKERSELLNQIEVQKVQHQAELLAESDKWKNKGLLDRLFKR